MSVHLLRQIDTIKDMMRRYGQMVETAVEESIRAVTDRDGDRAQQVIAGDNAINQLEVELEEECLHTLALHQPVAHDLRYLVAVLKINNDLERIGDHAVNIAEQARFLTEEEPLQSIPYDLQAMTEKVQAMFRAAIQSVLDSDTDAADAVGAMDDEVDAIHRRMYEQVERAIRNDPSHVQQLVHYMNVSRHLERIADLAVNIAEDVIYMVRGDIARHKSTRADTTDPSASSR